MPKPTSTLMDRTSSDLVPARHPVLKHAAIAIASALGFWLVAANLVWILQFREPALRVTEVHAREKTVTLQRGNHKYTVRCGERCRDFDVGESYLMKNRGGVLEYRGFSYPIIEYEVVFPTTPGGLG